MGMIPNAALRVSASPFVMPHGWRWVTPPGPLFPSAHCGLLRFTGRLDVAGGSNGETAADDGLFPPIFARVNKAGTQWRG